MRGFEPAGQYLRVDCPQVLARTSAQGAGEADEIISRCWRAARPRCRRSVGGLWGRRPPDNLEFRLFRSAAGKPASDRTHLTVFQWLPPILFGCLALCQACAARCGLGWCHEGWRRHQRQERQTCQEGSHRYPHNPIRQSALSQLFLPGQHSGFTAWSRRGTMPLRPLTLLGMESSEPTPECQRLTVCLRKELGRERRLAEAGRVRASASCGFPSNPGLDSTFPVESFQAPRR
jgi:hypothetical protein